MNDLDLYRRNIGRFYSSLKTHGGPFPQSYGKVTKAFGNDLAGWLIKEIKAALSLCIEKTISSFLFLRDKETHTNVQQEQKWSNRRKEWKRMRNKGISVRQKKQNCRRERKRRKSVKPYDDAIQNADNLPKKKKETEISMSHSNGKLASQGRDSSLLHQQSSSVNAVRRSIITKETRCTSATSHNNCSISRHSSGNSSAQTSIKLLPKFQPSFRDILDCQKSQNALVLPPLGAIWYADQVGNNDDVNDSIGDNNRNEEFRADNSPNRSRSLQNTPPGSDIDSQSCPATSSNKAISRTLCLAAIQDQIQDRDVKTVNQQLRDRTICKICKCREATTANLPCGHLVCCVQCASTSTSTAFNKCPVCRTAIVDTINVSVDV